MFNDERNFCHRNSIPLKIDWLPWVIIAALKLYKGLSGNGTGLLGKSRTRLQAYPRRRLRSACRRKAARARVSLSKDSIIMRPCVPTRPHCFIQDAPE